MSARRTEISDEVFRRFSFLLDSVIELAFFLDKRPKGPDFKLIKPLNRIRRQSQAYSSILQIKRLQSSWQHLPNDSSSKG
jgi:hypothetical protein